MHVTLLVWIISLGLAGALLDYIVTIVYARVQGWGISLPLWVAILAVVMTAAVGTLAGLYPAIKASRESPTHALASM